MTTSAKAAAQIRPARQADLPAVAEIYWSAWHETHAPFIPAPVVEHRTHRFFAERARGFGQRLIVAELDGRVIGFAVWDHERLEQLWLPGDARGLGIGSQLAEAAETAIAAAGATKASLTCMAANEAGRTFYERRGWSVVAHFDKPLGTAEGSLPVPCLRMEKVLLADRR